MDKDIKEFDRFIRNKVSDVEFSREKDSWELLNYQLKEKAKTKRRNRILAYLFSLLFVASGVLFFVMPVKKETKAVGSGRKLDVQTYTAPVNASTNPEIKNNPSQSNRETPLRDKKGNISIDEPQQIVNNNAEKNQSEVVAEIQEVEPVAAPDFSEERLAALVNSSSWESDLFKIEITNVGNVVNSAYADFAPVISADGATMFFTSRRPTENKEIKHGKQALERIYTCSLNSKNKWTNTLMLPGAINTNGRNNSVIWLSHDGQRMFLYRDDVYGNGDIYESTFNGTDWSVPLIMAAPVNTKYHESSACISPDGKTLYFVSDRPGGVGARDIWFCTRDENGKWNHATNMGATINSPQDEEGIFVTSDNKTIYFSSNRHDGLGGYDIYRITFENGKWTIPVNLGAPLNTAGDDVYFVMEENGTTGFYASSGQGDSGEKDIYKVTFLWSKTNK
jgi:Tol biopolymer transport system component